MRNRVRSISHPSFLHTNLVKLAKPFIHNTYPKLLVLKTLCSPENLRHSDNVFSPQLTDKIYKPLLYIDSLTPKIRQIMSNTNIVIANKSYHTNQKLISKNQKKEKVLCCVFHILYQLWRNLHRAESSVF